MAGRLLVLARTVLLLLAVSVLAAAFPLQPWSPLWFLRLSQVLIDYSPAFILAAVLALIANFYEPNAQQKKLARWLPILGAWIYAILIPLQAINYGWYWLNSNSQIRATISNAQSRLAPLRSRINAAQDETTLMAIVSNGRPIPPLPINRPPLAEQKREFLAAVDRDLTSLRSNLNQQHNQQLITLLVGTVRGLIGAAVVAVGLLAVMR